MQHADTQTFTYLRPECTVQFGRGGGGGLARSTEPAAEGGRPGSRPAVTLNLDLVSIGVSGPASPRRTLPPRTRPQKHKSGCARAQRTKLATDLEAMHTVQVFKTATDTQTHSYLRRCSH